MLRPRPLSRALATVLAGLALLAPVLPAGPAEAISDDGGGATRARAAPHNHVVAQTEEPATPLTPTIDRLSRSVVPTKEKGRIQVTGTVTNDDSVTWRNVRVYPFIGSTPMTTEAEVRAAAVSDPTIPVGDRITQEGCSTACVAQVGDLAPGQSATYTLVVSRAELDATSSAVGASSPGIYWFGVHTLGETDEQAFDELADGRARTFLPLLPHLRKNITPEPVSLLLQVRRRVLYRPDGSIADEAGWANELTTGTLGALVAFGTTPAPVTWLVDPAVLDAVRRLAAGNPDRSVATAPESSGTASPTPTPTPSPTTSSEDPEHAAAQQAAKTWLAAFEAAVKGHQVLALPYGDPDLAAVADQDRSLYTSARTRSDAVLKQLGVSATPVVAPLSGYLDQAALRMVGGKSLTIVGDQMFSGRAPTVAKVGRNELHTTSAAAAAGGPLPGDPLSAVGMRQRIVTEAALRFVEHRRPLVVALPYDWLPPASDAESFLAAMDQPWLSLRSLGAQITAPRTVEAQRLRYPQAEADAQVQPYVMDAVHSLISAGLTLDDVLASHPGVSNETLEEALTSVSYSARGGQGLAALSSVRYIDSQLDGVRIDPPPAVTLSSDTGRFAVTLSNDLDQAVAVQLSPTYDSGIDVRVPTDLTIPAGGSSSVLITAAAHTNGVHYVTLQLTDSTGAPLGSAVRVPIRSAQVSRIIWIFVAAGLALLFAAITVRLVRRIRAARRETTEASR